MRICLVNKVLHTVGEVDFRPVVCHFNVSPSSQWFRKHKQIACPLPFILIIISFRLTRLGRNRYSCLPQQLFGAFIETDNGTVWIIRFLIHVQYLFHLAHKFCIGLWWDYPLLILPRFKFVFFNAFRTVSYETLSNSTCSNLTKRSLNKLSVQLARPSGGAPQANAIR